MKRNTKIISFLLIFVMVFMTFPLGQVVFADEFWGDDSYFDDGEDAYYEEYFTDSEVITNITGSFVWPLDDLNATIDSPFGFRRSTGRVHMGFDVVRPVGTPVYAAASGTVRTSTREGAWGNLIIIEHDYPFNSLSTFYAHLHTREAGITPGTRVEAGQLIGTVGRTGNATAPHLHFELRINNMPVNPLPMFHPNEARATVNPNPLFIRHNGAWTFNPYFDPTFTEHEHAVHRQGATSFLLPLRDGTPAPEQSELPNQSESQVPFEIYNPDDLGLLPQTPAIVDSFAFGASLWAAPEIDQAISIGIIPENLLYNFQSEITRAEFAETAVRTILVLSGALSDTDEDAFAQYVSLLISESNPFDDTDNVFVIIAHYLYIVNGVGVRTFAPDNPITRQEAATMLSRVALALGITEYGNLPVSFTDNALFAPWAADAIEFVASNGVMGGIGNNEFSPGGLYTREQTFVTMIRLAEILG